MFVPWLDSQKTIITQYISNCGLLRADTTTTLLELYNCINSEFLGLVYMLEDFRDKRIAHLEAHQKGKQYDMETLKQVARQMHHLIKTLRFAVALVYSFTKMFDNEVANLRVA